MPGDFHIVGTRKGSRAQVSSYNELITAPYDYSTAYFKTLDVVDTAYVFVPPIQDKFFVITSIILQADRDVSNSVPASVDIYEADQETDTTIAKSLLCFDMLRRDTIIITPTNIKVTQGRFLSGKTSDDDILATVSGYYVDNGV